MTTELNVLDRAVVVGGGSVGRLFAGLLASAASLRVIDIEQPSGLLPPNAVCRRADITAASDELEQALKQADVVVLALPESVASAVVSKVAQVMRPGALLVETCSVKSRICADLGRHASHLEALGLNPMFSPSLDMAGRAVAAVIVRGGPRTTGMLELLARRGSRVVELDAPRHDRLTAAAQVLPHAAILAFGAALAELDVSATELAQIAPPPCTAMLALLARIASGSPSVYWEIQATNPSAAAARAGLASALTRLTESVGRSDEPAFDQLLGRSRKALGEGLPYYRDLCAAIFQGLTTPDHTELHS